MMTITPVAINYLRNQNFKGNPRIVDVKKFPEYEVRTYETDASTGKKWGVGIASGVITGLGQAINGQWGKAAGFFFGSIAASAAGSAVGGKAVGLLATLAVQIWSIVDAVKSAKTNVTQIIRKGQVPTNINEVV